MAAAFSPAGLGLQRSSGAGPRALSVGRTSAFWGNGRLRGLPSPSETSSKAFAARVASPGSQGARRPGAVRTVALVPRSVGEVKEVFEELKDRIEEVRERVVNVIDQDKFGSLGLRRIVFDHEDWKKHKSSGRFLRHLRTIVTSKVIQALALPVMVMAGIATALVLWNSLLRMGFLPKFLPLLRISNIPFSLTAPALSLLLVFRTNSSYGRFDEARKMWGLMLNRTRDICRLALTYMARDKFTYEYPKRAQFLRHLQAFPLAYKHHLLQEGSLEEDLRKLTSLTEAEIQGVLAATHRPNYCLQVMSECVGRCHMPVATRLAMETDLATFADDIGGSERLFKTPIPLSYTRLTSRFLVVYHLFLPFALYDTLGWLTIPVTIIHTAVFFCIEEVGVLIENPFPVLALDAIAQSARNNVAELIARHDAIRDLVVEDDTSLRTLPADSQAALLPKAEGFVAEAELDYDSDWDEDVAGLPHVVEAQKQKQQRP